MRPTVSILLFSLLTTVAQAEDFEFYRNASQPEFQRILLTTSPVQVRVPVIRNSAHAVYSCVTDVIRAMLNETPFGSSISQIDIYGGAMTLIPKWEFTALTDDGAQFYGFAEVDVQVESRIRPVSQEFEYNNRVCTVKKLSGTGRYFELYDGAQNLVYFRMVE